MALRKAKSRNFHFNYFTIDFNEELTGVYGGTLDKQTGIVLWIIQIDSHYKHNKYKTILFDNKPQELCICAQQSPEDSLSKPLLRNIWKAALVFLIGQTKLVTFVKLICTDSNQDYEPICIMSRAQMHGSVYFKQNICSFKSR